MPSRLSPEQWAAVHSDAPLLVVAAGAGTGKTTTLTARAARLRERHGPEGRAVLAATFTVAAAREMAQRLAVGGANGVEGVDARTLHSLAYRICREFGLVRREPGWLLPEREAIEWIRESLGDDASLELPPGHRHPDEPLESALFRLFQRWGENDAEPGASPSGAALAFPPRVLELREAFQTRKRLEGRGDFSDLVRLATRHLEEGGAASRRWTYAHVLVDEAQDLNLGQIAMLRALCGSVDGLTLVGDDDQSLYAFRGAVPNLLENAERWFPALAARGVERIELRANRRCGSGVVEKALRLVNLNARRTPKRLEAGRDGPAPTAWLLPSEREEAVFVAWRVETLLASGVPPESVAVLARTSSALRAFEAELIARRVPVARRDGVGLLESAVARDVLAWLSLATTSDAAGAFLRVHARPPRGVGRMAAQRVVSLMEDADLGVRDALESLARGAFGEERDALFGFAEILERLQDLREEGGGAVDFVEGVARLSGYAEWLAAEGDEGRLEEFALLRRIAEGSLDLDEFLVSVCVSQSDDWLESRGRTQLTTLHGAKGLEWDHVFVVGAHARAMPHARAIEEFDIVRGNWPAALLRADPSLTIGRGGIEEERRLFHVGLTRARQTATVTCPAAIVTLGRRQAATPSPFLSEAGIALAEPAADWRRMAAARQASQRRAVETWTRESRGRAAATAEPSQPSLF